MCVPVQKKARGEEPMCMHIWRPKCVCRNGKLPKLAKRQTDRATWPDRRCIYSTREQTELRWARDPLVEKDWQIN